MKIPKGGLHNINQSSQANINDSWNILATDENNAVLIAVDKCGTKKTVGDTSNYMRLDGTEAGKEASGTYTYKNGVYTLTLSASGHAFRKNDTNEASILEYRNLVFTKLDGATSTYYTIDGISTSKDYILIGTPSSGSSKGLRGAFDYSANITDLDYTQKIYVDNPKTLINTLSNCNSTQLDEIKTILGIV